MDTSALYGHRMQARAIDDRVETERKKERKKGLLAWLDYDEDYDYHFIIVYLILFFVHKLNYSILRWELKRKKKDFGHDVCTKQRDIAAYYNRRCYESTLA